MEQIEDSLHAPIPWILEDVILILCSISEQSFNFSLNRHVSWSTGGNFKFLLQSEDLGGKDHPFS